MTRVGVGIRLAALKKISYAVIPDPDPGSVGKPLKKPLPCQRSGGREQSPSKDDPLWLVGCHFENCATDAESSSA